MHWLIGQLVLGAKDVKGSLVWIGIAHSQLVLKLQCLDKAVSPGGLTQDALHAASMSCYQQEQEAHHGGPTSIDGGIR